MIEVPWPHSTIPLAVGVGLLFEVDRPAAAVDVVESVALVATAVCSPLWFLLGGD